MEQDELEAIEELKSMSKEELDKVPYDKKKWQCHCKGCSRFNYVRDYGISPVFYVPVYRDKWINANTMYHICNKHWEVFKRLRKSFCNDEIEMKFLDYSLMPIDKIIDA